jgi:hypothetical protein
MQGQTPNIPAAYVQWLCGMPIVPGYPARNLFRKNYFKENPEICNMSDLLGRYPPAHGPGPIIGRGVFGKNARREHNSLIGLLTRDLFNKGILSSIMKINQNHFFSLYCLYRLNRLKNIGCMRRSDEDNINSRKGLLKMKMVGFIFFLGRRLGTSTHSTSNSIRPWIIHLFMMYVLNRMCSNGKHEYFGFQTGEMRENYRFQFQHEQMPAFRLNFKHRFDILMVHSGNFRFAKRLRLLSSFIWSAHNQRHDCRLPTYVFNGKDLPKTLHPDSVAIVRNLSYLLFFQFLKKYTLFAYECFMREFVRILLGFLIGTSEEKIEGAVMELFAVAFPLFSKREAPECFSVFFPLFKKCDSLDPEFFKKEADRMLAESIASPATNYSISSQQMQLLKIEEEKLLKLDRSPIQNIVLFVLYWNQKYASTWSFQFNLCSFLRAIHEII